MVSLNIHKNLVCLNKNENKDYESFINKYLVKYEETTKVDSYASTKNKRRYKSVKEKHNLFVETDSDIIFSRGVLELLPPYEYTINSSVPDTLTVPNLTDEEIEKTLDCFDLREDQVLAVKKALIMKRGIIQLPTATGKSAIITSIIKRLIEANPDLKVLVIAPTLSTVDNITDTLNENNLNAEVFDKHKDKFNTITTSLVQSLVTLPLEKTKVLQDVGAVFYDECVPGNAKILLPNGDTKTMLEIYEDDTLNEVLTFDIESQTYVTKKILRKFRTPFNNRFCKVYYEDILTGKLSGVTCTKNHKIYTKNRGYVEAQDLTQEDIIKVDYPFARNWQKLLNKTYVNVKRVTQNVGKFSDYKYNLEIEDTHNYFANNVLVSNCHHLKCETWNKLNTMLPNVEYSVGFSALSINKSEIYITDFSQLSCEAALIIGSAGRVLMHMDPSYYIQRGIIATPVVFMISHYEKPKQQIDDSDWIKLQKTLLLSDARTKKIAEIVSIFSKYKRKILILVSEKKYAWKLCEYLVSKDVTSFGISFGAGIGYTFKGIGHPTPEKELNLSYNKVESSKVIDLFDKNEIDVLIATSHLDEGVDIKSLDAVVLACGGKKDRKLIQRVGRVLRKTKSGKYAYIIDFTDSASPVLSRQAQIRLNMYKNDIGVPENFVFENIFLEKVERAFKYLEELE